MKVTKVCFVVPRAYYLFNPNIKGQKDKVGGAQKQAWLISRELAKRPDFEMHFCVADFGQKEDTETIDNVMLWKSFSFKQGRFKQIFKLFKTLKQIDAELYLFRASDKGVALTFLYLKYILKKKSFYMMASDSEASYRQHKKMQGFLTALLMPIVYKRSAVLTVQNKFQLTETEKNYRRKPNAEITNIITPPANNGTTSKEFVLWVGRLVPFKKPELFIRLAQNHPQVKFVMIAPYEFGNEIYGQKIVSDITEINNIEYHDFVEPKQMVSFYQKAILYVLTSEFEGLSNTMLEAMAAACPIYSYKVNTDNIITEHNTGFYAKGDEHVFLSEFGAFITDKNRLEETGLNALNYIKQHHTVEHVVPQVAKLIADA